MLQNIKELYGRKLGAIDGDIGHIHDFYFQDTNWAVRYLVVDTGPWLSGRQVLLSSHAFEPMILAKSAVGDAVIQVNLTRKQIENSPSIDTHRPVSRQYEEDYYRYYGWPTYWDGGGMMGMGTLPMEGPPSASADRPHHGHGQRDDIHLRSTKAVTGYGIHATDGLIGTVKSFLLDGRAWTICELEVETGHWYSGKEVLIPVGKVLSISFGESLVRVDLSKALIKKTGNHQLVESAG